VSEQILNGTSAQIGHTVPFTSVHAGKYRTEDKLITNTTQNNTKHSNTKLVWPHTPLRLIHWPVSNLFSNIYLGLSFHNAPVTSPHGRKRL